MKVLITGAAGFIGSHLAERLARAEHEVVGVDCFTDYYDVAQKRRNAVAVTESGCQLAELDLRTADLQQWVDGVEIVYHAAAQPGISDRVPFSTYVQNNIEATHRLLEALQSVTTLQMFVNIGTSSIYGLDATEPETTAPQPASYYGVTKLAAEQLALSYHRDRGLPACSLRLYSVYGARERPDKLYPRLIRSILEGTTFPLYEDAFSHSRSFTYVGDIVDAFVSVIDRREACLGEIINIGSDQMMKTKEAVETVEAIMRQKAQFEMRPRRGGDQLRTHAIIDKARMLLGFEPKTQFADGIVHEIEWMRELVQSGS
jgi:nucleoside-diphosphate-sugar epimerase